MSELLTALLSGNQKKANRILNSVDPTTLETVHLKVAIEKGMGNITKRLLDEFNVKPNLGSFNAALLYESPYEILEKLLDKGSKPNNISLNLALDYRKYQIAKQILDKGVRPTVIDLNKVLREGGYEIAKHILTTMEGVPSHDSLVLSLEKRQYEIAEEILKRGVEPNEEIEIVKNYMEHKRGMEHLRDYKEELSKKLEAFSENQLPPEILDIKQKALNFALVNHAPLKNGKRKKKTMGR